MLVNTLDITSKVSFSKNLITDQTFNNVTVRNNTAGVAFDVTLGLGEAANNTSVWVYLVGGFQNSRIISTMRYVAPTVQAGSEIGVMGRFVAPTSTGFTTASYYYARVDGGVARLTRVNGGAFTDLSTAAYALAVNVDVTITLTMVGTQITARFQGATGDLTLNATDASIAGGGLGGCRSLSSSIYNSVYSIAQL